MVDEVPYVETGEPGSDPSAVQAQGGSLGTSIADFVRHSAFNASGRQAPPLGIDTNLAVDNEMPHFRVPVSVSGTAISFRQTSFSFNRRGTTANYLRLQARMANGAVGDEAYIDYMVPLDGSGALDYIALPWVGISYAIGVGPPANAQVSAAATFLAVDETTVIGATGTQSMTASALAAMTDGAYRLQPVPTFSSRNGLAPPNARWMRVRLTVKRNGDPITAAWWVNFDIVRLQTGYTQLLIADSGTPLTYDYATIYQQDGAMHIAPAQGSHTGGKIILYAGGDVDFIAGPDAGDNVNYFRSGETFPRVSYDYDASGGTSLYLGPGGATTPDVRIYRAAADVLATDDTFQISERAAPGAAPAGTVYVYAKADGLIYGKDDAGVETVLSGGGGGGGSVATDTIWDAKGDLVTGTGPDAAARLAAAANDWMLMTDSTTPNGLKWVPPATPVLIGTANSEGTTDDYARGNHVHGHEVAHVAHDTIWNAKGDIVAGTGADAAANLAVGANNTVLTADSTQATGLKWAAAAGGSEWDTTIVKAANSSNTTATLANDAELTATLVSGGVYLIEVIGLYDNTGGAPGTPDLKVDLGEDAVKRGVFNVVGYSLTNVATQTVLDSDRTAVVTFGTFATTKMFNIRGLYISGGAATVLRFAQNTLTAASPTRILIGSIMRYKRIV